MVCALMCVYIFMWLYETKAYKKRSVHVCPSCSYRIITFEAESILYDIQLITVFDTCLVRIINW